MCATFSNMTTIETGCNVVIVGCLPLFFVSLWIVRDGGVRQDKVKITCRTVWQVRDNNMGECATRSWTNADTLHCAMLWVSPCKNSQFFDKHILDVDAQPLVYCTFGCNISGCGAGSSIRVAPACCSLCPLPHLCSWLLIPCCLSAPSLLFILHSHGGCFKNSSSSSVFSCPAFAAHCSERSS